MSALFNLFYSHIIAVNFTSPLAYLDLIIALALVVSFLVYLHHFPVFRALLGTMLILACSVLFFWTGFVFTSLVLGLAGGLVLISLPLIFAPEIRHYLEKLGRLPFLHLFTPSYGRRKVSFIKNLIDTVYDLADKKIGATLVLQRKTALGETIETGTRIDARFGAKLIQNIFFPKSPLHDGAVIITDERITAAGCLLPVSSEVILDTPFGTRHRSAVSVTLDTDAVVVVVSEQRGQVSLAENGHLHANLERAELSELLNKLLQ